MSTSKRRTRESEISSSMSEEIEDPMEKKMRQLDKLVDELAKGKPMEKVLR